MLEAESHWGCTDPRLQVCVRIISGKLLHAQMCSGHTRTSHGVRNNNNNNNDNKNNNNNNMETASAVDVMMDVDSVRAARRRRERRLRQFVRHERLSVAMALSEKKRHGALRGKDRAGRWVREVLQGQNPGEPTSPARALPAVRGRARRFPATLPG